MAIPSTDTAGAEQLIGAVAGLTEPNSAVVTIR